MGEQRTATSSTPTVVLPPAAVARWALIAASHPTLPAQPR